MAKPQLIDPELLPFINMLPVFDFSVEALPALRAGLIENFGALPPDETLPVTAAIHTIPGPAGAPPVRVLSYVPKDITGPLPALLHMHPGGYVLGAPEMSNDVNRRLAVALNCAIFSVDYRLAPETPHPGPIEDCYAALAWLNANAEALQIDPARIGVKGESAGGGLAAALALLARDRGEYRLAFQHLIYPMLDDRTCVATDPHPYAGELIWNNRDNHFGWSCLLGTAPGGEHVSPYASAARAENLTALPPAFISVAALDLLLEENLEYARRLTRAGVAVELHLYPGAFHGFDHATTAAVAAQANRDSLEALRRFLSR